ncbi:uncharacterized protein F5147DRAFT_772944 [Suillus discolor]|uniref:HMG box domain-containing protein n=1 Tax=Suillus discolor TaxID=1912936 RepID=A0A9P7F8U4_9AGAM|nr:uncharacterized protein F5147DRAFT_772944 [Suillus discolor]KAG2109651.1 hypothetical protein F5147DRAFT_772944 [Suillus discolor]
MAVPDAHINIHFNLNSISSYDLLDHISDPPYDFLSPPQFEAPLVPPDFQWHQVESVSTCIPSPQESASSSYASTSSTSSINSPKLTSELPFPSSFPSSAALASMPIPCSRGYSRSKDPDHVPRPRNAFMLFRSAFAAAQKIGTNIERDNRHITRIIAHCWNHLSESEKQVWRNKAATEKAVHAIKYPNYRFHPVLRAKKPTKRKVQRNGTEDKKRCEQVAELLLAGKHGEELEVAVKEIDDTMKVTTFISSPGSRSGLASKGIEPCEGDLDGCEIQPFRSPLLPPTTKSTGPSIYDIAGATQFSPPLATIKTIPKSYDCSEQLYQAPYDTNQPTSSTPPAHPLLLTQPDFHPLHQSSRLSPLPVPLYSEPSTLFINYDDDNISAFTPSPPDFSDFSWDTFSTSCYSTHSSHSYATFPSY